MKLKNEQPETIHCDQCGAPIASMSGHFLRRVLALCVNCQRGTRWYPSPKEVDRITTKGLKPDSTEK